MKVIDAHCHIGNGRYKKQDAEALIRSMDTCGIEKAVIVPVEEYITVNNEEGNNYILAAVKRYDGRLIGFATVNPWYGQKAVDMLRKYLKQGLKGVKLNPSLQGFLLNDDIVYPIIETAKYYKVPVYFHTGTPIHSLPFQLRDLAVRYPEVNFIMGHMGAWDFGYDTMLAVRGLKNIFLETSLNLSCVIESVIREAGSDRVIFGSDSPRSDQKYELEKVTSSCNREEDLEKILYKNITQLLEGEP